MKQIGNRVIIIGSPGSGKSTFAKKLSEILALPLIHLDKEYWNFGWIETPKEKWIEMQEEFIKMDKWIIDGNYGSTIDIRLRRADTIVCFCLPRTLCLFRAFKRYLINLNKVREDMAEGCKENFDLEFVKYIWDFPKNYGEKNIKLINENKDKKILIFKKRNEANDFIREILNYESNL
ncbi:adenylate kinase family enzyme [Clostridium acetobutylicum]|uniref:DNA topology modulation protein n=1 Tax=Clostridium TaxID=1485 RepID=UPI000200C06C|nr:MULTISPECIES: DNA topology modulation protein [Clostridium]ADZ21532.1 topology modulation protein [Clostridium acetobutylicum EA 2018]AEI32376.1 topology modulation protein [Clostridium acetobutylicum DSM 1731]AWV79148.1 DNA topology modulation protein [Clostridium acetobutylicum]MBC2394889.1 DNA topology modulation protein [Clostridium acetobutylicum]MBC2586263.1 DNA topology modulation protein [Clostridium acetobutylicum]